MDYNENIEPGVDVNVIQDGERVAITPPEDERLEIAPEDLHPEGVPQNVTFNFPRPKYTRTEEGFVQAGEDGKDLIDIIDVGDVVNYMDVVKVEEVDGKRKATLDFFGIETEIENSDQMFTALAKEVKDIWKQKLSDGFGKYQDYPKEGVLFEDINPVLRDKELLGILLELMSLRVNNEKCDYIIAPESRGFVLGAFICGNLGKPIILARKPGKLPGNVKSYTYKTEYSEDTLEIQEIDLTGKNVWFIDDIYATGGTYEACKNLVEQNGGTLAGGTVVKAVLGEAPEGIYTVL